MFVNRLFLFLYHSFFSLLIFYFLHTTTRRKKMPMRARKGQIRKRADGRRNVQRVRLL